MGRREQSSGHLWVDSSLSTNDGSPEQGERYEPISTRTGGWAVLQREPGHLVYQSATLWAGTLYMFLNCFLVAAIEHQSQWFGQLGGSWRMSIGEQQSNCVFFLKKKKRSHGVKLKRIYLREEAAKSLITFLKYIWGIIKQYIFRMYWRVFYFVLISTEDRVKGVELKL